MLGKLKTKTKNLIRKAGFDVVRSYPYRPAQYFHASSYLRHNVRRLEHMASLGIPVEGMLVLDVGACIGDHSHYYTDRQCEVTITEARTENLDYLKKRYPNHRVQFTDLDSPSDIEGAPFDVVHCYGLLYNLSKPQQVLSFLSANVARLLISSVVSHK